MPFHATDKHFLLNGEPFFMHSAEMHYFRIKRELWPEHLRKIKAAGCNTVSSYIPWDWHEVEEGVFDTTGRTSPERDIEGWLDLCREAGLFIVVKPGPYILAEYAGAGLPGWFLARHGRTCEVKNSAGETGQDGIVSFMHPVFLEAVKKWYDEILAIIAPRQIQRGGPIIMMQVCNEVGVFTWLCKSADNSPQCLRRFRQFLRGKYGDLQALGSIYGRTFADFDEIVPLPDTQREYRDPFEMALDQDWHEFWRHYYADYIGLLIGEMDARGIELQLYHNLPGWIYGSGYEFPVNITMYSEFQRFYPRLVLGVDHIPENVSYRNLHDDLIINEIVLAQQGRRGPLFGAEFQAGSREACAVTFPGELDLFYKASLANGLVGWNYYMFSSGKNPERKGHFGPTFYWFTALDEKAEEGGLYPVIKKMGDWLGLFGSKIARAEKKADVAVLFYQRYYATELAKEYPRGTPGLSVDPAAIRKDAYFNGLLKVLQLLNVDFDILDAENSTEAQWGQYRQLWVFSCDIMDTAVQERILRYAEEGGSVIVYPTLPRFDTQMREARSLREALGVEGEERVALQAPKADVLGVPDLAVSRHLLSYRVNGVHQVAAQTADGRMCGFTKAIGAGKVMVLGFYLGYSIEEHKDAYRAIIEAMGVASNQSGSQGGKWIVKQRFLETEGFLFIGNYDNEATRDRVTYTHPESGAQLTIPLDGSTMTLAPISGVVSPINLRLTEGLHLLHTTSDLRDIQVQGNRIRIVLSGHPASQGELAFSGPRAKDLRRVSLDSVPVELRAHGDLRQVQYGHRGPEQQVDLELPW